MLVVVHSTHTRDYYVTLQLRRCLDLSTALADLFKTLLSRELRLAHQPADYDTQKCHSAGARCCVLYKRSQLA